MNSAGAARTGNRLRPLTPPPAPSPGQWCRFAQARPPPDVTFLTGRNCDFSNGRRHRQILRPWAAASQDTSGTKAAQTANKPTVIPVTVKYVRIVFSPPRLGPRNHDAVTQETVC